MKSIQNLRLQLRLTQGALLLTLGLATTAAVSTHQLLLDATNKPASDVSLASAHWTGTLDAARLPTALNPASTGATTAGTGRFTTLDAGTYGIFSVDVNGSVLANALNTGGISVGGDGSYIDDGIISTDGSGNI